MAATTANMTTSSFTLLSSVRRVPTSLRLVARLSLCFSLFLSVPHCPCPLCADELIQDTYRSDPTRPFNWKKGAGYIKYGETDAHEAEREAKVKAWKEYLEENERRRRTPKKRKGASNNNNTESGEDSGEQAGEGDSSPSAGNKEEEEQ